MSDVFRTMTVANRSERTHGLEVIERELVAEEVEEDVLESAGVSVGEDEAITVGPLGVGRVAVEELGCTRTRGERFWSAPERLRKMSQRRQRTEQDVGHGGHSHRSSSCRDNDLRSV